MERTTEIARHGLDVPGTTLLVDISERSPRLKSRFMALGIRTNSPPVRAERTPKIRGNEFWSKGTDYPGRRRANKATACERRVTLSL